MIKILHRGDRGNGMRYVIKRTLYNIILILSYPPTNSRLSVRKYLPVGTAWVTDKGNSLRCDRPV